MNRISAFCLLTCVMLGGSIGKAQHGLERGWLAKHSGDYSSVTSNLAVDQNGNALVSTAVHKRGSSIIMGKNSHISFIGDEKKLGYPNLVLSQYSSAGNINWSLTIECKEAIYAHSIIVDSENNYLVGGSFKHDANFIGTQGNRIYIPYQTAEDYNKSMHRFYIAKYTNEGKLLWVKTGVAWDEAFCKKIITDKEGNVYAWVYTMSVYLVVEDYIFQRYEKGHPVGRNELTLVKIDAQGDIKWITRAGMNFDPFDIFLNTENQICVQGAVSMPWYCFKYVDGTETVIDEREDKAKYGQSETYILSSDNGHLLRREKSIGADLYGHVNRIEPLKSGYMKWLAPRYKPTDRRSILRIGDKDLSVEYQQWTRALCKVNRADEIEWYVCLKADMRGKFESIVELADGSFYSLVTIQGESTFIQSNGDSISFPYERNMNNTYAMKFSKEGIIDNDFKLRVGSYSSRQTIERAQLASVNGKDVYMINNINFPGRYLEREFEPAYKDKNYELYGSFNMGYISYNVLFKDSFEIFVPDTSKPLLFASAYPIDTIPDSIEYSAAKPDAKIDTPYSIIKRDTLGIVKVAPPVQDKKTEVFLYPNPVMADNVDFFLRFTDRHGEGARVMIFDGKGSSVFVKEYATLQGLNDLRIRLSGDMKRGMYLVRVIIGSEVVVKRLIIG